MPFSLTGPDFNAPQPAPLHNLRINHQPVDAWVDNPVSGPLTPEGRENQEKQETNKKREGQYERVRNHIAQTLALYGPTGKPEKKDRDGNKTKPSIRRNWSSTRTNQHFLMAAASGIYGQTMTEFEPRRIANPIRAYKARKALEAQGFDRIAFEEAQAVVGVWPDDLLVNAPGIVTSPSNTEGSVASSKPSVVLPESPAADVWLVEALTPRRKALTAAEERVGRKAEPAKRVRLTDDLLNNIYEAYEADPNAQSANLQAALCLHVQNRFTSKLDRMIVADSAVEPRDVLTDFVMEVLLLLESDKYVHSGKFAHWIGTLWSNFRSKAMQELYDEANRSIGLNPLDEFDDAGNEVLGGRDGRLNPVDVDWQQAQRDTSSLNDASSQVSRMIRMLDDPNSEIGQLDDTTKSVIRAMAKGEKKTAIAKKHDVDTRTLNRWLEPLKDLRQDLFVTSDDIRKNVRAVSK